MVGGCLSCFFTYISVLLLWVGLHDVEASRCQKIIHKKVGDTVELSSCFIPTEGVTSAIWKYGEKKIADKDADISVEQFKGRLYFNPTSFSLTVRELTLKDSGDFMFVSAVNDEQSKTVTIPLKVHEPITEEPEVTYNSTWHASNESCTVWLECRTNYVNVSYSWVVRNQTMNGFRLQYTTRQQDGDIKFTCTISNVASNKSITRTEKCTNVTATENSQTLIIILSAAGGGCLTIVVIVGVLVWFCHRKQSQANIDSNDLTVYADITDVATEHGTSSTMKPCTLYETIESRVSPTVTPGPQTVYDQIQFSRMKNASVSPYQDVS